MWTFGEIGPALGKKHKLVSGLAQRGGERGTDPTPYMEQLVADELRVSPQWWSTAKAGRERPGRRDYVRETHLRALASYFHLDANHYLGPEAWRVYTPEVTVEQLELRLLEIGYGGQTYMRPGSQRAIDSLLALLRTDFGMTRQGITVVMARDLGLGGPTRATGVVDELMEQEEESRSLFAPGDAIAVGLEASRGWHAVLLQATDSTVAPHFTLRCVAPSYRHPSTEWSPGELLPMQPDGKGRPGLKLGKDPGLVDLIAILTRGEPLPLPFVVPKEPRFHVVDPGAELQRIRGALAGFPAHSRRVLHAPMRVA